MLIALSGLFNFRVAGVNRPSCWPGAVGHHVNNTYFCGGGTFLRDLWRLHMGVYAAIYHGSLNSPARCITRAWGSFHFPAHLSYGTTWHFSDAHPSRADGMPRPGVVLRPEFRLLESACQPSVAFLLGSRFISLLLQIIWVSSLCAASRRRPTPGTRSAWSGWLPFALRPETRGERNPRDQRPLRLRQRPSLVEHQERYPAPLNFPRHGQA